MRLLRALAAGVGAAALHGAVAYLIAVLAGIHACEAWGRRS